MIPLPVVYVIPGPALHAVAYLGALGAAFVGLMFCVYKSVADNGIDDITMTETEATVVGWIFMLYMMALFAIL